MAFCLYIFLQCSIVIQMFLMEIGKDSNMRRNSHIFQLVTGKFTYDLCVLSHFFHMIKHRNTDISYQDRIHPSFL